MPSLLSGSIIAAALAAAPVTSSNETTRPITLVAEQTGQGLLVRLIGQSSIDLKLRYRLQLGGVQGSNRVNQGGSANLVGGDEPRTLATIRMSGSDLSGQLIVDYDSGGGYIEIIDAPTGD